MSPPPARRLLCALAFLATSVTFACGGDETPAPPALTPPTAEAPASTPGPAVPPVRDAVALPKDFPEDVPTYPGATSVVSSSVPEEGTLVSFESQDTAEAVFEFYRNQLVERGWAVEGEMSSADQRMLIAGKGPRKTSVLVEGSEGATTHVTLTLTDDAS
jgi:hypothetical protein